MITIFTIPKAFDNAHIKTIQRNAIQSWINLGSQIEIILIGKDNGVAKTAAEFGVRNIRNVEYSEQGTPLLSSAFKLVKEAAKNNRLCYINADIVLMGDFIKSVILLPSHNYLAVGRRIDLNIKEEINFNNLGWQNNLEQEIIKNGKLHSWAGIDYFIFNRKSFDDLPKLVVGRIGWDNWILSESRKRKMKLIDMTSMVRVIHQNHDHPKLNQGKERKTNPEAKINILYIKNKAYNFTIEDANYELTDYGIKKKPFYWIPFVKRYLKMLLNR